jgi:hypothetical protein
MIKAAAIGGGAAGVAASIPIVSALNCLCCSLILGGGFLAAFLYSKECAAQGASFRAGNGALVGLTASPFYALAAAVFGSLVQLVVGTDMEQMLEMMEQYGGDMPPEAMEFLEGMSTWGLGTFFLFGFMLSLFMGAIFSTLGGLIGGAVFKSEMQPPAPPAAAPPAPPAPQPPVGGGGTPPSPGI